MSSLTDDLAATIGAEHVLTGPDPMTGYTTDWTRRYQGPPPVWPGRGQPRGSQPRCRCALGTALDPIGLLNPASCSPELLVTRSGDQVAP